MHFNAASTVWFIVIQVTPFFNAIVLVQDLKITSGTRLKQKNDSNISWKEYRLFQDDIYHFTSLLIFLKQILLFINVEELAQNKQL